MGGMGDVEDGMLARYARGVNARIEEDIARARGEFLWTLNGYGINVGYKD